MQIIKAPVSRFKRKVVDTAFKSGSIYEKRRIEKEGYPWSYITSSHDSRGSVQDRGVLEFSIAPMALGFNLDAFLRKRKNAIVFEIGCGRGVLLTNFRERYKNNIAKTVGLDLYNFVIHKHNKQHINELLTGDARVVRFPKSDLIVSQWTAGYIRNTNFLLKKIENALKPGGVALIHFNCEGVSGMSYENDKRVTPLLKYIAKVKKIGNSSVKAIVINKKIINGFMNSGIEDNLKGRMPSGMKDSFEWKSIGGGGPSWIHLLGDPLILIQKPKKKEIVA